MRILLSIVILSIGLFACKSKKEVSEKEQALTEQTQEELVEKPSKEVAVESQQKIDFPENAVARIQRTACFGRCPIYTLTVYEDGTVLYQAEKWVEKEGTFQGKADPEWFKKLLAKAEEVGYFNMKNKYDSEGVTDLPSVITTLRRDDELKQIVNRYQGPEALADFEKYFDSLYLKLNWSEQDGE